MSNFKIGDLIVPNDKFYKTPSSTIARRMCLFTSFIDDLKKVFNNDSSPLRIINIEVGGRTGRVWLRVHWEGHPIVIEDGYGSKIDDFSYLAEYFKLYEEKELNDLVLDNGLLSELI